MKNLLLGLALLMISVSSQAMKIVKIDDQESIQAFAKEGCPFVNLDRTLRARVMPQESRKALTDIRKALKDKTNVKFMLRGIVQEKCWLSYTIKIGGKEKVDPFYLQVKFVDYDNEDEAELLEELEAKVDAEKDPKASALKKQNDKLKAELKAKKQAKSTDKKSNDDDDDENDQLKKELAQLKAELASTEKQKLEAELALVKTQLAAVKSNGQKAKK